MIPPATLKNQPWGLIHGLLSLTTEVRESRSLREINKTRPACGFLKRDILEGLCRRRAWVVGPGGMTVAGL